MTGTGRAYLSLGSNIDAERWLVAAVGELRVRFGEIDVSPVYRSAAVGFDGPDFFNLAVAIDSDLSPDALNDWLHALEDRHGRIRGGARYGSRTLDVDIVLFDDLVLSGKGNLKLPRGELRHAFVLKPMVDIGSSSGQRPDHGRALGGFSDRKRTPNAGRSMHRSRQRQVLGSP
jgi:2-amino-4-hydroxy-6-hydroxymethyldihydropteridine diphosphokinase